MEYNPSVEMGAPAIFDGNVDKTWDGGGVPNFQTTYISMYSVLVQYYHTFQKICSK